MLIAFEGVNASGKTTQAKMLAKKINALYFHAVEDSPYQETTINHYLNSYQDKEDCVNFLMLLKLYEKKILPNIGKDIIVENYIDGMTVGLQARGIKPTKCFDLIPKPDISFVLLIDKNEAQKRRKHVDVELLDKEYHAFIKYAKNNPHVVLVNATRNPHEVSSYISSVLDNLLVKT